jgi:hypothetical protein
MDSPTDKPRCRGTVPNDKEGNSQVNLAPEGYDEQVLPTPEQELSAFLLEQEEADMLEMEDDCDWQAEQQAAYNYGMGD